MIVDRNSVQLGSVPNVQLSGPQYNVASPVSLSNASTITPPYAPTYAIVPVTESGNVTGIILGKPTSTGAGQMITILNRSNFTVTFDVSGTSNVADGTSDVIPALCARTFVYDASTSLWYRYG